MHNFVVGMFKHVLPGYLELVVVRCPNVLLRTVDPMVIVEWVRIFSVCVNLRVVSCIQECEERVDIYLKQDCWSARF